MPRKENGRWKWPEKAVHQHYYPLDTKKYRAAQDGSIRLVALLKARKIMRRRRVNRRTLKLIRRTEKAKGAAS